VAFFIVVGLIIGGWWANFVGDALCDRRDQDRAMWLWLADYVARPDGSNQAQINDMLAELEERIPACPS
jgi:hypothetical protein